MNKEFHYWITGVIANAAGFDNGEVRTIAYSSQFVDDNDNDISVYDDEMSPDPSYQSQISQTMDILLPRRDLAGIYPMFHFIPGDQGDAAPRKDKKTHVLNTTPNSSDAKLIMQDAVNSYLNDESLGLYRLGIATHAYADTWAHQNFTGSWDDFNDMGNLATPDVGHADALHHPDWVSHRWSDDRLVDPNISNITRFIDAARCIYGFYCGFLQPKGKNANVSWDVLQKSLLDIFGTTYSGSTETGVAVRVGKYQAEVPFLVDYDDRDWQFAALKSSMVLDPTTDASKEKFFWQNGISRETTDWYNFQEAVKAHKCAAGDILKHVYALAGVVV